MNSTKLQFGDFELDVAGYELSRSGRPIRLERIPMELLIFLVERRGQLVTRNEILEKLWGKEVFLDIDNSINTAISKIRVALKDNPDNPAFIKTISGKGYRFIGSVSPLPKDQIALTPSLAARGERLPPTQTPNDGGSTGIEERQSSNDHLTAQPPRFLRASGMAASNEAQSQFNTRPLSKPSRWWLWTSVAALTFVTAIVAWSSRDSLRRTVNPTRGPVIRSLAVLPLENLTGDQSQEYFADSMTDALITDLAQIGALRVISRTSIMRYKGMRKPLPEIARELGVDGIVEGTVTRSAGRIRITSQLIYAPADQHLWAHSYERDSGDAVVLQGEVAEAIAEEVRAVLTPEQRTRLSARATTNSDAYEAYLKGRYYWNQRTPEGMQKSVVFFQQAVEKDSNFALAYAGLADAYNFCTILGVLTPKESSPQAKAAAAKALALDPQLGEAHAALGLVKSHYDFDFPGAQKEFLRAIELNPNYSNARLFYAGAYLTPMGLHENAIAEMKKALDLDPLSVPLNNMLGQTYLWAGDYEKSQQQFRHTIDLDPTFPLAHFFFSALLAELGKYLEATKENERAELLSGASPEQVAAETLEIQKAFHSGGPRAFWQKNLDLTLSAYKHAGSRYFQAVAVAGAYARVGDRENAFKWLEKSYDNREGQTITLVRWLPDFKNLHTDPRFTDLLHRMGLPH